MRLIVKTKDEYKKVDELVVGDEVFCDNGLYMPVKNIYYISSNPIYCKTSDNKIMYFSNRMQVKTVKGFKVPELWDILPIRDDFTPMIVYANTIDRVAIFRDILIDGNMVTVDGVIFRYCYEKDANGKEKE